MTSPETNEAPRQFQRTLRRAVLAPLVLATVLICLLALAVRELRESANWVEHTTAVQAKSYQLEKINLDLETGLRGYLLFQETEFLEPYRDGAVQFTAVGTELKQLIADNPAQEAQLQNIMRLFSDWKIQADAAIVKPKAINVKTALARKMDMDEIRAQFDKFIGEEARLKSLRLNRLTRVSELTIFMGAVAIGALLALLAFLLRGWFVSTVKSFNRRVTQLGLEREKLQTILTSIGDAVLVVDNHAQIQFLNPVAETLTQWRLSDAVGRPMNQVFRIVNQYTRQPAENPVEQVLRKGVVVGLANHTVLIGKNGHEIPIEDSAAPIRLGADQPIEGVILVFRDVSIKYESDRVLEEKQRRLISSEEQLRELVEALRAANNAKSAFLANMSHEIRTPLGAILGFTDLLREGELPEADRANYLSIVARNGQQLHDLINDILDFSKVEAGRLQFEMHACDLHEMIDDTVTMFQVRANEKRVTLEIDMPEKIPQVMTDPTRCRQILTNIVGNAIKFTEQGQVKVQLRYEPKGDLAILVKIRVSDTGIGISDEERANIFKTFSQADVSTTRKFGGSGLGLVLAKTFAQGMGGDLQLESSMPGQGSTFLITLRLELASSKPGAATKPAVRSVAPDILKGLKILLVEDSVDNRYLIERLLRDRGAKVDCVVNGAEGVDLAMKGDYDLILMDISMPVLDGYSATLRLRESGYDKPIIALTAHAMSEVRIKCLNAGCNDHLSKPIEPTVLYSTIAQITGRL